MLTAAVTEWTSSTAPATQAPEDVDGALARSAGTGDMAAFEALYRRHSGRVHGVIARLVGGHAGRAEDLTQEAFVRAWQALPTYRFESAFSTWLPMLSSASSSLLASGRLRRVRSSISAVLTASRWSQVEKALSKR